MLRKVVLIGAAALSLATTVRGDLYRVTGPDGADVFTDSPTQPGAVLLHRERRAAESPKPRQAAPESRRLPVRGKITSRVGLRQDPFNGKLRHHGGVDIAVPAGTEVRPIAAGYVSYSGYRGGYGNLVILEHANGAVSLYAHNARNLVAAGHRVQAGEIIALAGSTGRSTGPHLHFEIWKGGANYTEAYLTNTHPAGLLPEGAGDAIYRLAMADGSLFFTNIPVR